jgi:hypothetical protein
MIGANPLRRVSSDGVGSPADHVKAKGGSPPPVDQPALVAVAKSKVVVG